MKLTIKQWTAVIDAVESAKDRKQHEIEKFLEYAKAQHRVDRNGYDHYNFKDDSDREMYNDFEREYETLCVALNELQSQQV